VLLERFEGVPLKRIALSVGGRRARGEAVVTRAGLEGGVVYALSGAVRDALGQAERPVTVFVDLLPDMAPEFLKDKLDGLRQGLSLSNFLRVRVGLSPVAIGLVQEALHSGREVTSLAELVKGVPVVVTGMQPIERAISSAGGVMREAVDERLMLLGRPGVFVAGEMLDWEAPTGGYLLQACFATGAWAARGAMAWIDGRAGL
jgi:predicted flavoprotein YhiN